MTVRCNRRLAPETGAGSAGFFGRAGWRARRAVRDAAVAARTVVHTGSALGSATRRIVRVPVAGTAAWNAGVIAEVLATRATRWAC